jgi:hypothetical protein
VAHEVRVRIDTALVAHKDLEVIVRTGDGKLGTLLISKGNIEWLPRGNSVNKSHLSWESFADLMETHGKRRKVR